MTTAITGFKGEYRWLSNFWIAPITYEGMTAPTNEHIYQACKTLIPEERAVILSLKTPSVAKLAGKRITLRKDWELVKNVLMWELQWEKYTQHSDLRNKLKATGKAYIEETNTWGDSYWGVCNGVGQNRLGVILMDVRSKL